MMRSALGTLTASARNPVTGKLALGTTFGIMILYDIDRGISDARTLPEMRGHPVPPTHVSPTAISSRARTSRGSWAYCTRHLNGACLKGRSIKKIVLPSRGAAGGVPRGGTHGQAGGSGVT